MDAEISILLCQVFSEKQIFSLLSNQLRRVFDNLYRARILGRDKLGSSTMDSTATIMWDMLQSHEVRVCLCVCVCDRTPSCGVCSNYEVVEFQSRKVTPP